MKQIISLLLILFVIHTTEAQTPTFQWAQSMGGSGAGGNAVATDGLGNVYTTGYYNTAMSINLGTGSDYLSAVDSSDIFIVKCDPSGNLIWAKSIGGIGNDLASSIKLDAAGNIYVCGYFAYTVDFDPGIGSSNLTANGGGDIFILKLNPSGNFVWAKKMGGTEHDRPLSMAISASGDVYTSGFFRGTADFDPGAGNYLLSSLTAANDVFISKLNTSGNFVWANKIGSSNADEGTGIALDITGSVYLCGNFLGTMDIDPGTAVVNIISSGPDFFILKLTSSGNYVWGKRVGGSGNDVANSITIDNNSDVIIAGKFQGSVDFDPGISTFNITHNSANGSIYNYYVLKLSPTSNFVFAKAFGGIQSQGDMSCVIADVSGNIYMTGAFDGNQVDFDPGAGVFTLSRIGFSPEIFITKFSSTGNFVYAGQMGFSFGYYVGKSIALDVSNTQLYCSGWFMESGDFDPGVGNTTLFADTYGDAFIQKMSFSTPCISATLPEVSLSSASVCSGQSTTLYVVGGSLNNATDWYWYSGSCGGTFVGIGTSITVSPSTTTNYFVRGEGGCAAAGPCAGIPIIANGTKSFIVRAFIEGYYISNQLMTPCLMNEGKGTDPDVTDTLRLTIYDNTIFHNTLYTTKGVLYTNGYVGFILPCSITGNYYFSISHRNAILTFCETPINFSTTNEYNFTTAQTKAYGANMKQVSTNAWAFYSGDIDNEYDINILDLGYIESGINNFASGYTNLDVNGDGNVDILDIGIVENNILNFVSSQFPW